MEILKHDKLKYTLAELLETACGKLNSSLKADAIYDLIGTPPDSSMGHFAFPCFTLSKELKSAPNKIAEELCNAFSANEMVETIKAAGPYANIKISSKFLGTSIGEEVLSGKYFQRTLLNAPPKTMIEYSQPNTHKELHVGHMRNLCLGDSLIRLHKYSGFDIVSATFPGDMGTHVAKCLWYMKFHNTEPAPATEKGAWLGSMYSKGSIKLEDERGTPAEATNREILSQILHQLENGSGVYFDLWKETREWSIQLMNEAYTWAGVHFDKWYWESEVDGPSLELAKKYKEKGIFTESQGTIGIDLSEYNLGWCMLVKTDGHGLYATKDIELARRKFEDFHIEKSVYIVDLRQAHHFKQVFKTLEIMGFENAKNCYHLAYDYVELPEGPMASRKGNIIPLFDLIHQMEATIRNEYLAKYIGEWPEDEIAKTSAVIAKGAIKYGMLKMDPSKKIVFDMKEWLKLDGDSGPYLQYAAARIQSLVSKVEGDWRNPDWSLLTEPIESEILVKLSEFNRVALSSCLEYKPNTLCIYLFELCRLYSNFYSNVPVKRADNDALTGARLALSQSVFLVLQKGLELLGIEVPQRM